MLQRDKTMHPNPLTGIKACVFDAYGTLFDVAAAANRCRDLLGAKEVQLSQLWRMKQLQYTWLRASQNKHADFWQVTQDALDFALESLDIADSSLRQKLMDLYLTLDAFEDSRDALARAKAAGFVTAILSNGSPSMLAAAIANARLGALLDHVLSVEEVGVFKPDPRVYRLAVDRLAVPPDAIAFVTSNGWDAYAASAFGLKVVWCNRYAQTRERLPGNPDREITSLAEFHAVVAG